MKSTAFGRRDFLVGAGVVLATGASLMHGPSARAEAVVQVGADEWRRRLADEYLPSGELRIRQLQDGLELWEVSGGGYMIAEPRLQTLIEASPTARSPYAGVPGQLAYGGPGSYYTFDSSRAVDLMTGQHQDTREMLGSARAVDEVTRGRLVLPAMDEAALARPLADATRSTMLKAADDLPRVKSGDVKSRVSGYSYITGCHVYPNRVGICGWVAGSIVTRYWHARSSARILLPSKYRSGTNMTSSPNFATYLQGDGGDATWAPNIEERLAWNAKKQKAKYVSSWAVGAVGMWPELDAGYPPILFGNLPTGDKKKGAHAVVAYGETNSGYPITHYGWSGYTNIILSGASIGSNARFRLT